MAYYSGTTTAAERALWNSLWKDTVPNMSFSQVVDVWLGMTQLTGGLGLSAKDAMTTTAYVGLYAGVNAGTVTKQIAQELTGYSTEISSNGAVYNVASANDLANMTMTFYKPILLELAEFCNIDISVFSKYSVPEIVLTYAKYRIGDPYSQPNRSGIKGKPVDCSYLVYWAYEAAGIELPTNSGEQGKYCRDNGFSIKKEDLQSGDLIFYHFKPTTNALGISHVAIFLEDGKVLDAAGKSVAIRKIYSDASVVLYARPQW